METVQNGHFIANTDTCLTLVVIFSKKTLEKNSKKLSVTKKNYSAPVGETEKTVTELQRISPAHSPFVRFLL